MTRQTHPPGKRYIYIYKIPAKKILTGTLRRYHACCQLLTDFYYSALCLGLPEVQLGAGDGDGGCEMKMVIPFAGYPIHHHLVVFWGLLCVVKISMVWIVDVEHVGKVVRAWGKIHVLSIHLQFTQVLADVFTLQETNIIPKNAILKMIFLFPRWDMLIPWRVYLKEDLSIQDWFTVFCPGSMLPIDWRSSFPPLPRDLMEQMTDLAVADSERVMSLKLTNASNVLCIH